MSALLRYAGLIAAPVAWAASTQLGQITPSVDCATRSAWTLLGAAVALFVGSAGGALSFVGTRGDVTATDRFIARMSALTGLVIAFALCLQTIATLVMDPCVR